MRPEFETTPKLGFGCMRLPLLDPADQQSIDLEQFKQMVDAFIEGGGTYFDTAFVYHEGASEKALKEALVKRYPRDAYTVATKCLAWAAPSAEEAKSNLATSLERMGLDYVDFYCCTMWAASARPSSTRTACGTSRWMPRSAASSGTSASPCTTAPMRWTRC